MKFASYTKLHFLQLLFFIFSTVTFPQQIGRTEFEYISPLPNSKYISPFTNILIRQGEKIDGTTLNKKLIIVTGSISGIHTGKFFLADDGRTLIFNPINSFTEGEIVTTTLEEGIKTSFQIGIGALSFNFQISESWKNNLYKKFITEFIQEFGDSGNENQIISNKQEIFNNTSSSETFPEDLPNVYVTVDNNPSDGYIFIAPWYFQGNFYDPNYLMIIDNYGMPIYYKKNTVLALDFKVQPNGILTYHDEGVDAFYGMDSSYNIIDTFKCGNEYPTDFHDIQLLQNGHYLIMGQDYQTVRMDTIVQGGDTAAIVIGQIVQEKDENHNVIFQWRSWDHFLITDASDNIDLTAHTIDYVHANSIELDYDGNLILSCRNMNEVTKIDRSTGELIWRMGGKNNQFQFLNDPRGFSYQHDARRIENGNITIFDNGNLSTPRYSSSLEYIVNEVRKSLTLNWSYSDDNKYSAAMGNSQSLNDGRTFVGWGSSFNPAATEVEYDGTKAFEIKFDSLYYSYRAFRFNWRTNLLTADVYNIDFEYVPINENRTRNVTITNNSSDVLQLTNYYSRSSKFAVVDSFPFMLQPFQSKVLQIQFSPDSVGVFSDDIHLRMHKLRIQKKNEMIAQVISVIGYSDPISNVEENENILRYYELSQNYPNPFNPTTSIKYQIPELSFVKIKVYDVLGNEVATFVNGEKSVGSYEVEFDGSKLTSGIYFYRIKAGNYIETKKMVLLK